MVEIIDLVPKDKGRDVTVQNMLAEFKNLSKVAIIKEEDYVLRHIIRGTPRTKIVEALDKKYPDANIRSADIDDFLYLYKDLFQDEKNKIEKGYKRRILKQQEGLTSKLIDLASKTEMLVDKFQEEDDNTNTIAALRVASDIFMKVGKIEGIFNDKPEMSVTLQMDKIVSKVTAGESAFKKSILKIVEVEEPVVVEAEVVEDD